MFDEIDKTLILDLIIIIYHLCSLRGRGGGEGSSQIMRTTMDEVKKTSNEVYWCKRRRSHYNNSGNKHQIPPALPAP